MKKYFCVTFKWSDDDDVYCENLCHAENEEAVKEKYSEYPWYTAREARPYEVEEAKRRGMPIIEA